MLVRSGLAKPTMKLVLLTVIVFHCTAQVFDLNFLDLSDEPTCPAIRYTYSLSVKMCQVATSSGPVTQLSREDSLQIKNLYPGVFRSYRLSPLLERSTRSTRYYRQSCCKTYESYIAERSLTNLHDEKRELVHLRSIKLFQYVRKGICGKFL